jgi:hypothetical protein
MIVADQMLYPTDISDPDSPGMHRAMIEQVFAAHELGINAVEVTGGKATISTQVSHFAGDQPAPAAPDSITVEPASARSLKVSWKKTMGAVAYEVLKRKEGFAGTREPNGKREYADGDQTTTGFRHVAYVDGDATTYEDKGAIHEVYAPEGLGNLFDHTYVVRAVAVNSTGQLGFSDLSEQATPFKEQQNLTAQIDAAISNISFAGGVMAFDNKLTNVRGAFSTDKTVYTPLQFQITSISNPSVTVKNADAEGNTFVYNQTLALGATSAAKRLEFNDPLGVMFSFDAQIYGTAYAGSKIGAPGQSGDGSSEPPAPVTYSVFSEQKTGTLLFGDPTATLGTASATWGDPQFKGITWDDIAITTKSDALFLDATLSSTLGVDMDFELRTQDGQVLSDSAGATAAEHVSAAVQPNTTYILRVKGFAHGPADYTVLSKQLLPDGSPNQNAGTVVAGGNAANTIVRATTAIIPRLVRFNVNPLTRKVTTQILR